MVAASAFNILQGKHDLIQITQNYKTIQKSDNDKFLEYDFDIAGFVDIWHTAL